MLFLIFDNADIQLLKKTLIWTIYIIKDALLIICQVKLINKNKLIKAGLYKDIKAFVAYINSFAAKITFN